MKPIHVIVRLIFFAVAASQPANTGNKKRLDLPLLFFALAESYTEQKDITALALIPAYLIVGILLLIFIAWALWRITRNWGARKIHAPSPRPHYVRTLLGWVDREKWDLKQANLAHRKEAKRDKPRLYRTSKANYEWVFHDPTGKLQQRFIDQKKQSYLRFLPSWMRSYPHGSIHPDSLAEQGKPPKGIYQCPELQSSTHSRHSRLEPLQYTQLNGYPIMEYPNAIVSSALGKSRLLTKLPTMEEPDVVQVWHIRDTSLPEHMGDPLESEQETNGEAESSEAALQHVTEHALREGRALEVLYETMNRPSGGVASPHLPLLPTLTAPLPRHPPVHSGQPVRDPIPPGPESANFQAMASRPSLGSIADQHPAGSSSQAQLQNNQVNQLPAPIQNTAVGFELRPRRSRDILRRLLSSMTTLHPDDVGLIRTMEGISRLAFADIQHHHRAFVNRLQDSQYTPDDLDAQAHLTNIHTSTVLYRVLHLTQANLTPALGPARPGRQRLLRDFQAHREANRASIEGLTVDGASSPNPTSEEEIRIDNQHPIAAALLHSIADHDAILEQSEPPAQAPLESEEDIRAEATRQAAALYNYDAIGRSDSAPPDIRVHDFQAENDAALTPMLIIRSSSDPTLPGPRTTLSQAAETGTPSDPTVPSLTTSATQTTATGTPSDPNLPSPTSIAPQASATGTLSPQELQELEDALNEELYTDAY